MSDKARFEYEDNFNKTKLRAEIFDDEITIATCYHGAWQQVYLKLEQVQEFIQFLTAKAQELELRNKPDDDNDIL